MLSKKKYLIFDLDDTVTSKLQEISDEMAKILNELPYEVAFISGTDVSETKRMVSSKLKRKHHILGASGTHYVIVENKIEKEIINENFSGSEKKEIINAIKKLKEKYNLTPLTEEKDQILDRGAQITFSILGRSAPAEKKKVYDQSKEKRKKFIRFINKFLKEKYSIRIGGTTSIDITKKGLDKSYGMEKFMEINKANKEEILFFGDQLQEGGNDFAVKEMGIECVEVRNPSETLKILENFNNKGIVDN